MTSHYPEVDCATQYHDLVYGVYYVYWYTLYTCLVNLLLKESPPPPGASWIEGEPRQ